MKNIATKTLIFIFLFSAYLTSAERAALAEENQLKDVVKLVMPATVLVMTYDAKGKPLAQGSGFFVSETGEVITNYHVFKDAESIEIKCPDNSVYKITLVIAEDLTSDLVKLQADIGGKKVPWLQLNKTKIEVGEKIVVIGSPKGLESTVSDGIVSAVRDVPGFGNIIQITAPISPGSSGSAVVNMKGEVIGVASAQMLEGQNLNFVVPVEKIAALKVKKQSIAASKPKGAEKQSNTSIIVKDADGNVYTTVKIGKQVWTVENLRTTKYNDGSAIPLVTDYIAWENLTTPGYCWYDNDIKNKSKYGALYNWFAVDTKKLAPKGWHVPTDAEWDTLQNYLIANGYNWDGTKTDNKIAKSMTAKTDWQTHTTPGVPGNDLSKNNKSGFSALPGGRRNGYGNFDGIDYDGHWWSATEDGASSAYSCHLDYDYDNLDRGGSYKGGGYSVRLLRDVENQSDDIYSAAIAYYFAEDYEKALPLFKQYLQNNKNSAEAWFYIGHCYGEPSWYQEAIDAFKQAIKLKPDYAAAHYNLGLAYGKSGRYQEAIEACKQAIRLKPDLAEAHVNLGVAYAELGRHKEAIKAFKQAIKLNPDDASAHYNLGNAYFKSSRYQEAIEAYKQAIKLKPDLAGAHVNLGVAFYELHRYQEAIETYKQAIKVKPDHANAHYNLGRAYGKLGRYQEAIGAYKQAIKVKPDFADAHSVLGLTYLIIGNKGSALEEYKILKTLDPEKANELFNLIYK
jgi:uncharacterized protein (TIGR02145 family)